MADKKLEMDVAPALDDSADEPVSVKVNIDIAEQNLRDDPLMVRGYAMAPLADEVEVTDKMSADNAAAVLAIIATAIKAGEERLEVWSREPGRRLGQVRALVKLAVAPLVTAKDRLAEKLVVWRQSEQVLAMDAAAETARQAQEARVARAEGKPPPGPPVEVYPELPPTTFDTPDGQVTITSRWTHRIVEPNEVPDEFWKPDPVAINEAIRQGQRHIPGVEVYQKDSVGVRTSSSVVADGP